MRDLPIYCRDLLFYSTMWGLGNQTSNQTKSVLILILVKPFGWQSTFFLTKDPWTRRFTHGELILCEERGTLKLLYDLFCLWKEEKSGKKLGVWKLTDDLSCFLCKIFISISFWKFRSKILVSIPASIYFARYCSQRENCLF